jgi:glutamate synthase (NADH)
MEEVPGSEKFFPAQLVFLALGFLGPENEVLKGLSIKQDARSNIQTPHKSYATSVDGVFAAGDCRRGQSLIVWGINEGRGAAAEIDTWLSGTTSRLPTAGGIKARSFVPPPAKVANGAVSVA